MGPCLARSVRAAANAARCDRWSRQGGRSRAGAGPGGAGGGDAGCGPVLAADARASRDQVPVRRELRDGLHCRAADLRPRADAMGSGPRRSTAVLRLAGRGADETLQLSSIMDNPRAWRAVRGPSVPEPALPACREVARFGSPTTQLA